MEKKDLNNLISNELSRIGFKKKGNSWVDNKGEVIKIVKLEKSSFGHRFYISFGYILKDVPLEGVRMHLYYRLSSEDPQEREQIERLLDLENDIYDAERALKLTTFIENGLISKLQAINSEADIELELKSRPNLNAVPPAVKKHFSLG